MSDWITSGRVSRRPASSSFCTCSKSGRNVLKSSHLLRVAISSAARFSALDRTWRSAPMSGALASTPSSASNASSSMPSGDGEAASGEWLRRS